jgi:hypothetical protein
MSSNTRCDDNQLLWLSYALSALNEGLVLLSSLLFDNWCLFASSSLLQLSVFEHKQALFPQS